MKTTNILMTLLATVVLASCESEPSETLQANIDTGNVSTYDPANGIVPFPIDLLFQGTTDLTLNIPVADPADFSDPKVALNALDGFSTNAPFSAGFAGPIDKSTVLPSTVRVFAVTLSTDPGPGGAVVNVISELVFGVDFFATVSSIDPATLVILPLKPLKPKKSYQVVVTKGLKSVKGNSMLPSTTYALAKSSSPYYSLPSGPRTPGLPAAFAGFTDARLASLEGLRQLIFTSESFAAADPDVVPSLLASDIILSWSFTTQSVEDVLAATRSQVRALSTIAGFSPVVASDSPLGAATIHVGIIQVPYFLTAATSTSDVTALNSFWQGAGGSNLTQYNPAPVSTSPQTIPLLVSVPKLSTACPSMPVAGWPVVIFEHGITRNRTDMLAVADSMATACMAVMSMDMPMHGLTGLETNGTQAFYKAGGTPERTFDLDIVTQDVSGNVTAYAGDGVTDSSGISFINLTNLLNTRDNLRQAVSDLFVLVDALEENMVTDGATLLDPGKIYFLGHSLGAIVGTSFLALEPGVRDAVLAMGGSAVAKILDGSAAYGPVIAAGLAANGVTKGTADYESFLGAAQTVVDSADPVNYSLNAAEYSASAAVGRGLLFFEVVGDSVLGNPSDLVLPNTVPDSNDVSGTIDGPLAGSEPQIALLGLSQQNATTAATGDLLVTTKYTAGTHSSLLDPTSSMVVTTEMQTQAAFFFGSDGALLSVTDDSVLLAP